MDSREPMHHHHHSIVVGSTSTPPPAYLSSHGDGAPGPSSGGFMQQQPRFPFDSLSSLSSAVDQHPHHPGLEAGVLEGSGRGGGGGSGFSIDSGKKKKRGRPRKYTSEGNTALGLGPTGSGGGGSGSGPFDGISTPGSSGMPVKKHRGRPPGVGKKQMDALGVHGPGGIGFTPHVILVKAGEDIASKIMSFTQQGPRTVCILSANGAVSNVTLWQPSMSVGTVSYEGRFEIISISGSFIFSEDDGGRSRNDSLIVSLAGSDGRVLGGVVAGLLMAAGPVQVIVGSFIPNGRKLELNSSAIKSEPASLSAQGQGQHSQMKFSTAATATAVSPSSQGGSGESSDENGDSPVNQHPPGLFNDSRQPGGPGIQMYHPVWAGQASQ